MPAGPYLLLDVDPGARHPERAARRGAAPADRPPAAPRSRSPRGSPSWSPTPACCAAATASRCWARAPATSASPPCGSAPAGRGWAGATRARRTPGSARPPAPAGSANGRRADTRGPGVGFRTSMSQNGSRSAGAHRPGHATRGRWTEHRRTVRRPAPAGRPEQPVTPAVVSHGHGAAVVGTQASCSPRRCPSSTPACGPATWSRSPARRTRSPCSRASWASGRARVESEPRMSLLGSRAPDALTMCRRYLERAAAHRRVGPAARAGRGRLRRRPRRLARGPALRVGLQPAPGRARRSSAICLYDRRRLPPAVVDSAAATHPQLVAGHGLVGERRLPGPRRLRARPCRCPGPPSRTATRSSRRERPHPGRPPAPARRRAGHAGPRPRPAGGPAPGRQRDRRERLPARRPAGVGAGLGRRRPGHLRHQRPGHLLHATRSAGSPRRTASTSPGAAWASGWPASSGTTSTCCPPTPGCRSG